MLRPNLEKIFTIDFAMLRIYIFDRELFGPIANFFMNFGRKKYAIRPKEFAIKFFGRINFFIIFERLRTFFIILSFLYNTLLLISFKGLIIHGCTVPKY